MKLTTHNSQLTTRTGLLPGTFDPFTIGHDALVRRALNIVDELFIAIGINTEKRTMLSLEERMERIATLYKDEPRIHVVSYEGLTTDFAQSIGAQCIIRGVRNTIDFEYERNIADVNRMLTGIDTLLLISEAQYAAISSSMVRELAHFGKDISKYLP
jgi:pantetheine-phosphate adenylyltransferase